MQQNQQRQQWHSTSGAATMPVKAAAKAVAQAKAAVLANLAAPAKRQWCSISNSKGTAIAAAPVKSEEMAKCQ